MNRNIVLFLTIIGLSFLGCQQNPVTSSIPSIENGREYFPNTDGYSWAYDAVENTNLPFQFVRTDTFSGTASIEGKTLQIFKYSYDKRYNNSEILLSIDDSRVLYYGTINLQEKEPIVLLAFPIKQGNTWHYTSTVPASVLSQEAVTVPLGTYSNCFKIRIFVEDPNIAYTDRWYAKNIGMVKQIDTYYDKTTDVYKLKSKNF